MKIAFVWDWDVVEHQTIGWQDGLAAALKEIERRGHHLGVFCPGDISRELIHPYFQIHIRKNLDLAIEEFEPDVILMWADQTRPNAQPLFKLGRPMALCFAGGNPFGDNLDIWDHIFVESEYYKVRYNDEGYDNVSIAFGTNTELFTPVPNQPKIFDTIFPATFAHWKRHGLYAEAVRGLKSLAVGLIQPNGIDEGSWKDTLEKGSVILPHVTAEVLRYLYSASKICVVTSGSDGGSQRTVLEAMAMNIPLIVTDSNKFDYAWGHGTFECEPDPREIRSYINALLDGEQDINTRDYVLEYWSEKNYADSLLEGLEKINEVPTL